jgi:hypothetical protein
VLVVFEWIKLIAVTAGCTKPALLLSQVFTAAYRWAFRRIACSG